MIGIDLGEVESEAFWLEFLRALRERGLEGVRLCVSDEHKGLTAAIARVLACPWQRCTVHFVRNMHQHCRTAAALARFRGEADELIFDPKKEDPGARAEWLEHRD